VSAVRAAAVCALAAAACVEVDDTMQPWVAAPAITGALATELGPAIAAPAAAPATLRIASWNTFKAPDPAALAAEILASPVLATADVILVQEIEDYPGEPASRTAQLATALGMTWFYAPARIEDGGGTHGDAILSRFPLSAPEVKRLPHVDMPIGGQPRIGQRAVLDLGGGRTLAVVNVHLDTRIGAVDRIRQLDPAVSDNPAEVIVGGDLNTLPWVWVDTAVPLVGTEAIVGQDQAQIIDDYLRDLGFATPLPHDADTHETPFTMRLDALFPRGLAPLAAGVDRDIRGSDHYAVWIDVDLRPLQ
jgi:endonuclease/exonuclease/phosphatase family metal-dependent hydrolase